MAKRSENKDKVLLFLSNNKEALETNGLKPLKDAFPDETIRNLSKWKIEFIKKGYNIPEYIQKGLNILNQLKPDKEPVNQITIKEKEPIKTDLKGTQKDLKPIQKQSITFTGSQPEEPKEIKENCYYTVDQTADRLQVDSSIIYRMIKNKSLQVLNIGATGARPTFRILGKWILEIKPE